MATACCGLCPPAAAFDIRARAIRRLPACEFGVVMMTPTAMAAVRVGYIFKTTVLYQVYTVNWIIHCSSTLQKFNSSEADWQRTV